MAKEVLHVVPHNEGWAVKREGNERSSSTHGTQKDAIDSARELAHEGDDIVIHRPDGTIRDRMTYVGSNGATNEKGEKVTPSDVRSVGTRVSWAAVIAGAAVALTAYLAFMLLAYAIGETAGAGSGGASSTFVLGTAIVMTVALLGSLFLGGYVTSLTTAGETKREAVIYGVLVWAALFGLVFIGGNTLTMGFGSVLQALTQARDIPTLSEMELQQKNAEQRAEYDQALATAKANASTVAWWAFATMVLSLMAAIGGTLVGSGPELTFWRPARPALATAGGPAVVAAKPT
jgi:hypothetical protein